MGPPTPATSPIVWEAPDYQSNVIRITITFNTGTRAITGITVFRDAACVYTKIYVGLGGDGTPDSSTRKVTVPAGTTVLNAGQLSALAGAGLATAEDFQAANITAGP
jgi:hypothetical protein